VLELRRIIAALSPAVLERLGLKAALRQLVARFGKMHPAKVNLRVGANSAGFPRQIQEVIYRVAQECLQNIAKHSKATHVNLLLQSADKRIRLSVRDNGAGMSETAEADKPLSFGLAGMRERAALLGGTLTILSEPGKGSLSSWICLANRCWRDRMGWQGMAKIRVLLTDDHTLFRQGIRTLLSAEPDMEVSGEAGNASDAVSVARQVRPDVVLMDIGMAGMSSFEATRLIRKDRPKPVSCSCPCTTTKTTWRNASTWGPAGTF